MFQDGATALTIASQCGHVELVDFLLENEADTTTQLVRMYGHYGVIIQQFFYRTMGKQLYILLQVKGLLM